MTTSSHNSGGSQKLCANSECRKPIGVTRPTWKCPNGCFVRRCAQCSICDACLDPRRCNLPPNPAISIIPPISMQISEGMSSLISFPCSLNSPNTQPPEIKTTLAKGTSQIRASQMIKHKTPLGIGHTRPRNLLGDTPLRFPFPNNEISPRNPLSRVPPATPLTAKNKTSELSIHNPLSRVLPSTPMVAKNKTNELSIHNSLSRVPPATPVAIAKNQITNKEKESKMRSTNHPLASSTTTGNQLLNSSKIGSKSFPAVKPQSHNGNGRSQTAMKDDRLARYKPKITHEELKQISRDLKAKVTPLFEKKLTNSDAGRIGRLVLPKRCVETYLPPVKGDLGDDLKIQDSKGSEWVLTLRFWPNNNSRMYVLEGFNTLVKLMDLKEGDTVLFSKLEPQGKPSESELEQTQGKLLMGFRKAKTPSSSNQTVVTLSPHNDVSKGNTSSTRLCSVSQVKPNNQSVIESEVVRANAPVRAKRRSSKLGSTSKVIIEPEKEMVELDLTSKEAHELVRPPLGSNVPTRMVIDGVEILGHQDELVIGRPTIIEVLVGGMIQWSQCNQCFKWRKVPLDVVPPAGWTCSKNQWDPQRSKCSDIEEMMSDTTIKKMFPTTNHQGSPKKRKIGDKQPETAVAPDTTVAVIPDENVKATTKHPRHRPGCSCIVCVQAPSGTKHNSTCTCGGCITLRRRHQGVNSRRAKKPSGPIRRKRTRRPGKPTAVNQKKPSPPQPDNSMEQQAEPGGCSSAEQPTSSLKPVNPETNKPAEHHQMITESSWSSIPADTNVNERFLFDLNLMPDPEDEE